MNSTWLWMIVACVFNVVVVLALAPLAEGLLRKLTALVQSRRGPPVSQPYYDLLKLLGKEDLESGDSPWVQRLAACLGLASILTVACLLPLGLTSPPLNPVGDVLLLIYVLTLCGFSTLLAGLAAGSTFSMIGISREMMCMVMLEPLLAVALFVAALHAGSLRLDAALGGAIYASGVASWSGLMMAAIMLLGFQAFVQRVPFDLCEAETELMEGPFLEYSGPKLALLKYAQSIKLLVYSGLLVTLFIPWGSAWPAPLGWLCFWAKTGLVVVVVTWVAATRARYRIDQVIRYYAGLLGLAVIALGLASYGY